MHKQTEAKDEREWNMALAVARLAPDTGMVTMTCAALLAGNAELERLRYQVAEWEKLSDPVTLHANLLRGIPCRLDRAMFLHLAGDETPNAEVSGRTRSA